MKKNLFFLSLFLYAFNIYAQNASCTNCHEDQVDGLNKDIHGKLWGTKTTSNLQENCSKCHGPDEKHLAEKPKTSATILAFTKNSKSEIKEQNAACLACHTSNSKVAAWKMSKHASTSLACSSCHKVHAGPQASKPSAQDCLQCHKDIKQDLGKLSHHPVIEGKVTCIDCHNPHGTLGGRKALLADTNNQLCYKCHADKRGPFIWSHSPVQENCLTCHKPHGSRFKRLLADKVTTLCQNCHVSKGHGSTMFPTGSGGFNGTSSIKIVGRDCLNCHNTIHGSNAPAGGSNGEKSSGNFFVR